MNKNANKKVIMISLLAGLPILGIILIVILSPKNLPPQKNSNNISDNSIINDGFLGDKGQTVKPEGNKIFIDESKVSDGNFHAFNYYSEKAEKNIYFFVLKAPDGTYRAAANACEVCFNARKGFTQVGNLIRCENCRVTYPKSKIALEKGGCNPGPIDKNIQIDNNQLVINVQDVEAISYLF